MTDGKIIRFPRKDSVPKGAKLRWSAFEEGKAVALSGTYIMLRVGSSEKRRVVLESPGGSQREVGFFDTYKLAQDGAQADATSRLLEIVALRQKRN